MTKSEYESKLIQIRELREEVDRPRCINCDELWEGQCRQHGPIPEEYLYQVNDCPSYAPIIPF